MQFIFMQRQFNLNWAAAFATLAMLTIMGNLGVWQLSRGEEKKALLESMRQAQESKLEVLYQIPDNFTEWVYKKVELRGEYLVDQQFLLDNQYSGDAKDKRAGFDVLTPLLLKDQSVILVNRGWLPRKADKSEIPAVIFQQQSASVKGIIRLPSEKFSLGEITDQPLRWPKVVQTTDLPKLGEFLRREIQPVIIMLLPDEENGYTRIWQGKHDIRMGPAVHYGYAFQWFALSLTLLVLSLGMLFKTSRKV